MLVRAGRRERGRIDEMLSCAPVRRCETKSSRRSASCGKGLGPVTRIRWTERTPRLGWDVRYTLLGGRWRGADPLEHLDLRAADRVRRFSAQAFVACSDPVAAPTQDVAYWGTVCTKILQRGTNPAVSPHAEDLAGGAPDGAGLVESTTAAEVILRVAQGNVPWTLEPSVELHPTWEQPFLSVVERLRPDLLRWITPQVSLEALAGDPGSTSRWVDFFLWHPAGVPTVIEVDGSGHSRQRGVDRERDQLMDAARVQVLRLDGSESVDQHLLARRLAEVGVEAIGSSHESGSQDLRRAILGPASLHRFGYALIEAACRGFTKAGEPWVVDLDDPLGLVELAAGSVLDLLAAVDDLWGTGVVPREVQVGDTTWRRGNAGRFERSGTAPRPSAPDVRIVLDPDRPPHAALPVGLGAQIVIRHAFVPGRMSWSTPQSRERRNIDDPDSADGPLGVLVSDLFGLREFRDGQLPPIKRVLGGADCAVMLATGAGKSLIYQLASLLRPGIAVIVDPIVSLVDDQARRLREEGIDRVSALHAASLKRATSREAVYEAVATGESLFVFLTPERLQIQSFRGYLGGAADEQLVNLVVVDEAHCVSEWGHDFRTSYLRLGRNLRYLCRSADDVPPPVLALTGTASPAVLRDVLRGARYRPQRGGCTAEAVHVRSTESVLPSGW